MANSKADASDLELVFKVTKDQFDSIAKAANSLLVAHGAGLFGCAAYLREPKPPTLYGAQALVFTYFYSVSDSHSELAATGLRC
jgi:hypothetical protein